ncbi:MAG: hypothetical protein JST92_13580, partial [Deltaproteobacteria bacterium]|nr:hypothetical protein [Deltaproteobacteria bacterium]
MHRWLALLLCLAAPAQAGLMLAEKNPVKSLAFHKSAVHALAYSSDGKLLA